MKALYLDGGSGLHVELDGPALRVRRPGRADGRYPLPRIARVILAGRVHWRSDALTACLREHKPVAVLDSRGRFVRMLFRPPDQPYGLARHMGELLAVPRFRERYARWYHTAERAEMLAAVRSLAIHCPVLQPDRVWQRICLGQHRRWGIRPGRSYRYLLGVATAQIASAFALAGMPRDPQFWGLGEYQLLCHILQLERWRLAVLLEQILSGAQTQPSRRELTARFEAMASERDVRIEAWRRRALAAMMGVRIAEDQSLACEQCHTKAPPADVYRTILWFCQGIPRQDTECRRIPVERGETLRQGVRILRAYLEHDRRVHESYGAT